MFAPRLSLIIQDRDLHFFTQKKNETVVVFMRIFFFLFWNEHAGSQRRVLLLTGVWVSAEACTTEQLLSAVVQPRLHR